MRRNRRQRYPLRLLGEHLSDKRGRIILSNARITYIGGPTALVEWGKLRLLTDPTFDPAGTEYDLRSYKLKKSAGPALRAESLGHVNLVLLSHEHHFDNLDFSGRAFLPNVERVLTTPTAAERLGGNATGISNWETINVPAPESRVLRVTGVPALHGSPKDRGPVMGFVLAFDDEPDRAVYVSGDTIWYDGAAEVAKRFKVRIAMLFLGSAQIPEVGAYHLTMTAEEGIQAARAFPEAAIVPLHYEHWKHFAESRQNIEPAFQAAGINGRVHWMGRGVASDVPV